MSNTPKDNPENKTPEVKPIEAPAGLDLHPRPKTSVTVSKRAGAAVGFVALGLLLAFAYGGYRRQVHAQASAHDASIPKGVLPATAYASEVEKEIPSGNAPLVRDDPNRLQPPDTARQTQSTASAQANASCGIRSAHRPAISLQSRNRAALHDLSGSCRRPSAWLSADAKRSNSIGAVTGRTSDRRRIPAPAGGNDRSNRYPHWKCRLLRIPRR